MQGHLKISSDFSPSGIPGALLFIFGMASVWICMWLLALEFLGAPGPSMVSTYLFFILVAGFGPILGLPLMISGRVSRVEPIDSAPSMEHIPDVLKWPIVGM